MKNVKKISTLFALAIISFTTYAQQDAMFTHYMYNTLAVNPGYAGSRDALTVTALNRSQWTGFKGAPTTQTLTLHTPLKSDKIGIGFSVVNDQIGPLKNTSAYIDFAYMIKLNAKSKLSFGLKGGFNYMQLNLNSIALDDQTDVSFQTNTTSKFLPNFGFGIYYSRQKFYAGISTPKLLENNIKTYDSGSATKIAKEQRHYFVIAGTIFKLTDNIDLKPTTFIKITTAAPIQADITASFIFDKKLLAGLMYRTGDALGVLVGYNITDQFHIGYSFDWSYGIKTFKYNNGSHEIMLSYDFIFKDKGRVNSPRFF